MSSITIKPTDSDVDDGVLEETWKDCVVEKISELSRPTKVSEDGILTISCANSLVANELYLERNNLLQIVREKFSNLGIDIKVIEIDKNKMTRG